MIGKDIQSEGRIRFETESQLKKEFTQEEIDDMVFEAYKNQVKYRNGKIDEKLKERYKLLSKRTRKINYIKTVALITNTSLGSRNIKGNSLKTYFVVEDSNGVCILLNLTDGIDDSFVHNKEIQIIKNKSDILMLYNEQSSQDFQETIDFSYIEYVKIYSKIGLCNNINDNDIENVNYMLEIVDTNGKNILVDFITNKIYLRENIYCIKKYKNTKEDILFKKGEVLNIKKFPLNINLLKALNLFFDFKEVN